jgi:competence protein ComEC
MHLAILSGVLAFLLRRPLGTRWASLFGAVFILGYVFIIGSQPSLVRSVIMYLIGTFSLWGLLKGKPISLLCMAFIIQLLFQSEAGTSVSFILSYLALAGILTLGQTLHGLFRGRLPEILSGGLSASLGAFIVTAPVVVLYFGSLRPIGILAGLIIAPLSSLFMVIALAALVMRFLPLPLWDLLDIVLSWFYRIMEYLVSLAGFVPGITFSNPVPVFAFSILFWLVILLIQRQDNIYRNSVASLD